MRPSGRQHGAARRWGVDAGRGPIALIAPIAPAAPVATAAFLALLTTAFPAGATQPPQRPADIPPATQPGGPCTTAADADAPVYLPRLLRVVVNENDTRREYFFLQRRCGALLLRTNDLRELRIRSEDQDHVDINGQPYVNLNDYDGLTYKLDEAAQKVEIEGEPRIFYPTVINLEQDRVPRTTVEPGIFVNYGLFTADLVEGGRRQWTGSGTLGVFGEPGVLISDWLYYQQGDIDLTYRLATTFFHDMPERIATLRVGDIYTRGGAFGTTAQLGGIQYATNFQTRPWLITTPVEMMDATTRRLAVVDLFSEDPDTPERQARAAFLSGLATAPHGPVEVINIPTYQNGEYVLTLRDALGREVEVRQPYFFSLGLLRQGLHDFSYEAGLRRTNYLEDNYEDGFVVATHRYGFSQRLTGEVHAEVAEDGSAALGLTAATGVPRVGVVTATAAAAHDDTVGGVGYYGALSLENRYHDYGYALRGECRTEEFFLPTSGVVANNPLICRTLGSVSYAVTPVDSASLTVANAHFRNQQDSRIFRLGYVTRRWRGLNLSAFATLTEQPFPDWVAGFTVSATLASLYQLATGGPVKSRPDPESLADPRRVQLQLRGETGKNRDPVAVARASTSARIAEQDVGVQTTVGVVNRDLQTLTGIWGNRYLTSVAGLTRVDGSESYTAGAASGFAWFGGGFYPSRPLTASFAAVRLGPDHPDVRVNGYRTDSDGDVLINPMQPYRANPVVINAADLPMNARFEALRLAVVPRYRSGTVLRPQITVLRDVILTVHVSDRHGRVRPLPPGAWATVPGQDELFPVGEDGAVYVIGLGPVSTVTLHWNDRECALKVTLPAKQPVNAIPEYGPVVCEGMAP